MLQVFKWSNDSTIYEFHVFYSTPEFFQILFFFTCQITDSNVQAVASIWGLVALKLADDVILPFNYLSYALELQVCV